MTDIWIRLMISATKIVQRLWICFSDTVYLSRSVHAIQIYFKYSNKIHLMRPTDQNSSADNCAQHYLPIRLWGHVNQTKYYCHWILFTRLIQCAPFIYKCSIPQLLIVY